MNMKNITKLDDEKWLVRISYVDPLTGRRRRVKRNVQGSLGDAVKTRETLLAAAEDGAFGAGKPSKAEAQKPLLKWADSWIEYRAGFIAPSTAQTETYQLNAVMGDVGTWLPAGIELAHLDVLIRRWESGGEITITTVKNRRGCLLRFLRWVFKRVGRNPGFLREVETPRRRSQSRRGRSLSPDEAKAFLGEMESRYPQHYALVFTLLTTGQRFGSVTALRWEDIGEEWITFSRSHYRGEVKQGDKTGKTVRIPTPASLLAVLMGHKAQMKAGGHPNALLGLVFPTSKPAAESKTGGYQVAGDLRYAFSKVAEAAGIDPLTPHDLRRTFNSWAAERVSGTVLRSITGHSSSTMTDHYYHGSRAAKTATIEGVLSLVAGQ